MGPTVVYEPCNVFVSGEIPFFLLHDHVLHSAPRSRLSLSSRITSLRVKNLPFLKKFLPPLTSSSLRRISEGVAMWTLYHATFFVIEFALRSGLFTHSRSKNVLTFYVPTLILWFTLVYLPFVLFLPLWITVSLMLLTKHFSHLFLDTSQFSEGKVLL